MTAFYISAIGLGSLLLVGCASTEPYQTGQARYEMNGSGSAGDSARSAQAFCRQRGYDFANIDPDFTEGLVLVRHTSFLCMHDGDTITYPPAPAVVLMPD
jgi:hypothetical protein